MRGTTRRKRDGDDGGRDVPALVWRAQRGDLEAFACLAEEQQAALNRFCRRLMGDASSAEDLAQETLLRAQASIRRLGEPYRFGPWLFGIAANLAKKWWRVQARSPLSLESLMSAYPNVEWDESLYAVASPEQIEEAAEQTAVLREAVASLPVALSRVVVLHYLDGLDYAEVAAALDVPVSTVKGRLFKSRARLRHQLLTAGAVSPDTGPIPKRKVETMPDQKITDSQIAGSMRPKPTRPRTSRMGWPNVPAPIGDDEPRHIRIEIDRDALIDEIFAYVTARGSADNRHRALKELASKRNMFIARDFLNQMVLDGVTKRSDVEDLLDYLIEEGDLIAR